MRHICLYEIFLGKICFPVIFHENMRKIEAPRNVSLDDFREISSNYTKFRIVEKIKKNVFASALQLNGFFTIP